MHGQKKISAGPLLLRIALVLLCMVAFSTSMLAGLYARYSTKADGEDSARVARFDVKAEGLSGDVTVNASQADAAGTYQFTVKNDSEVAITYDLVITFEGGIPPLCPSLSGRQIRHVRWQHHHLLPRGIPCPCRSVQESHLNLHR